MELQLAKACYERNYGRMPPIKFENRFFEENPTDQQSGTALLSRPGTDELTAFGTGPIRALFSLDGVFNGDLFVTSGEDGNLYRYSRDGLTKTLLPGTIFGTAFTPMAATRHYLFITDGTSLQYYNGIGNYATSTLTTTGNFSDGETVTIGSFTYTFKTALTPTAFEVLIGADADASLANLAAATIATTGAGTKFAAATTVNTDALAAVTAANTLVATAVTAGTAGNSLASTETATNASWDGATFSGGTANALSGIPTPDDVAIVSLAVIAGYVCSWPPRATGCTGSSLISTALPCRSSTH
jgi:hypothetical protein